MVNLRYKFPEHVLVPSGCGSFSLVHKSTFDAANRPCTYAILPYHYLDLNQGGSIVSPNRIILDVPFDDWNGPFAHYTEDGSLSYFRSREDYAVSRLERIASRAPSSQQMDPKQDYGVLLGCLFPVVLPFVTVGAFLAYAYLTK
ncbi:MAG: hypothetical protein AABX98_05370 [Nanoarchaeota archaeon]